MDNMKDSLQVCSQHNELVHEEVDRLKDMLYEMEIGVISRKEKTLNLETSLTSMNRNVLDF